MWILQAASNPAEKHPVLCMIISVQFQSAEFYHSRLLSLAGEGPEGQEGEFSSLFSSQGANQFNKKVTSNYTLLR